MACKGVVFVLDLGLISLKEKTAIRQRVESAGGTINAIVGSAVRVVITTAAVRASGSYKLTSAEKLDIPIFLVEELDEVLSFPPAPRSASTAGSTSSLRSSAASGPAPLISWDTPSFSSLSDETPSHPAPSTTAPVALFASDSDEEASFPAFLMFGDEDQLASSSAPAPSRAPSSAAPSQTVVHNAVDDVDELFGVLSAWEDYDKPFVSSFTPGRPELAASTASTFSEEMLGFDLFDDAPAPAAAVKPARKPVSKPAPVKVKKEKVLPTYRPKQLQTSSPGKIIASSENRLVREAKYLEITSKTVEPLNVNPMTISAPSFTPLGFDLKPSSIAPSPAKTTVRRIGIAPTIITPLEPLVFETTVGFYDRSDDSSSPHSLRSSQTSISELKEQSASEPESDASMESPRQAYGLSDLSAPVYGSESDDEDYDDYDEDDYAEEAFEGKKNLTTSATSVTGGRSLKRVRMARLFVDRQTGEAWQRKDAKNKHPTKLVLDSGKGVSRVFDSVSNKISNDPTAKPRPARVQKPKATIVAKASVPLVPSAQVVEVVDATPASENLAGSDHWFKTEPSLVAFDATSIPSFGPPLPRVQSKVVRRIVTGSVDAKFTWVDIVTGKASTTKRVPALDGQKIFISGFKFDDILLHGKPRDEQFPFYKEEHLKKVKEKNAKAIRSLKKKQRKRAQENATVEADGTVVADGSKKATPKLSDAKQLERMKTDEQIMNDIVQWPARRVDATIAQRKELIQSIFMRFGEISQWNPDWEKGHIHVVYKRPDAARTAMRALKDFETRAAVVRRLRENNAKATKESLPSPSFYVRWPTCYQRKLDRKAENVKQQKLASQDAAVAKHAAAAASAAASISGKVKAKKTSS